MVVLTAMLLTIGPGALRPREDESALYNTDKETQLYLPRNDDWDEVGQQCSDEGIGLSMFLDMHKPIDVATIGVVYPLLVSCLLC